MNKTKTEQVESKATNSLRHGADEAVGEWRARASTATEARQRFNEAERAAEKRRSPGMPHPVETRLALLDQEMAMLEAEDAAAAARVRATVACDATDLASGDEFAIACDPASCHVSLIELIAEEERLRREHAEALRRAWLRIEAAQKGRSVLEGRRREAGLPPPAPLPRPPVSLSAPAPQAWRDAFAHAMEHGTVAPKSNAERLRRLRAEDVSLRAALEQERLNKEEDAKVAARQRESDRKEQERRDRAAAKEHRKEQARIQAERERIEGLATAHRARTRSEHVSRVPAVLQSEGSE